MIEIHNFNSKLMIKSNNNKLQIPIVDLYLKRLGFKKYDEHSLINAQIDYKTFNEVVNYLKNYDDDIKLDDYYQNFILDEENTKKNFLKIVDKAVKTKYQNHEYWKNYEIQIPEMNDKVKLKWYQKMPIIHAATIGNSANFSVPGSGKTWMAYSTFFKLKHEKKVDKLIIVAPLAAFKPWEIEYEIITGKKPSILRLTGTAGIRKEKFRQAIQYEILLISYTTAYIEILSLQKILQSSKFMMIIDESHHIKNPDANRTVALLKLAPLAKKRMILSGTMMPKSILDLWSQFTFLYPDQSILSSYERYKFQCDHLNSIATIAAKVDPFFTRISKNLLNLPAPIFNPTTGDSKPIVISMSPIQRRIYDNIANNLNNNIDQFRGDATALKKFRKKAIVYLIEAATDPSLLTKDHTYSSNEIDPTGLDMFELLEHYPRLKDEPLKKLDKAVELAKETLDQNEKIIIWCSFIETIKKLSKYFADLNYKSVQIYGAIPKDNEENEEFNRESEIEKFKNNGEYNILIANPASLAESISLHKHCHHAIYIDRTFNGGHYMQSLERIHRVGLVHSVKTRYDILQSECSVDQTIHNRLGDKIRNMEQFFNSSKLAIPPIDLDSAASVDEDSELETDFDAVINDLNEYGQNI